MLAASFCHQKVDMRESFQQLKNQQNMQENGPGGRAEIF